MNKISLMIIGFVATLVVGVTANLGVAAAPQGEEAKPAQASDTPPKSLVPVRTEDLPASSRILLAKLESALMSRAYAERFAKTGEISTQKLDNARTDVVVLVAEIEAKRDNLRDEVELLEVQFEVGRAELAAAAELQEELQQVHLHAKSVGATEQSAHLQWVMQKSKIRVKQAELKAAQVQLAQVKRRLEASESLVTIVKNISKPASEQQIKPDLPAPPVAR